MIFWVYYKRKLIVSRIRASTIATCIYNPGVRPTYSYRLACPMPVHPRKQACGLPSRLSGLS